MNECEHRQVRPRIRYRNGAPCKTASVYCVACGKKIKGMKVKIEAVLAGEI